MVSFALVGMRVEVDFDLDGMQFCIFKGSESVQTDESVLQKLIAENWEG